MHGANGDANQALRVALQRYVPCQMESLGCIQGTDTPLALHMVERAAFQPRRRDHPKYHEPW